MLPRNFDYATFVSFAQADRDLDREHFDMFLSELDVSLRARGHRNQFDRTHFVINRQSSGDFRDDLEVGQTSSVCCLSLYSPNYWDSRECAIERTFFYDRNLRPRYKIAGADHLEMFAVAWLHRATPHETPKADKVFPPSVRPEIRNLAYLRGEEFPNIYGQGVLQTFASPATRDEARLFTRHLATKLSEVVEKFAIAAPRPIKPGRTASLCVLAATPVQVEERMRDVMDDLDVSTADKDVLNECLGMRVETYRYGGGADWHPFSPNNPNRSIKNIVAGIVGSHVQEIVSPASPPGSLPHFIAHAEQQKEYVIIVVDPWSVLHFERFKLALSDFDEKNFKNCMLLVVRGPRDALYDAQASDIDRLMGPLFDRSRTTSMFFREVDSEPELKSAIRGLFERLRKALCAEPARPIDRSGPLNPITLSNSARAS